jgi:hypothetical protein
MKVQIQVNLYLHHKLWQYIEISRCAGNKGQWPVEKIPQCRLNEEKLNRKEEAISYISSTVLCNKIQKFSGNVYCEWSGSIIRT